MIQIIVNAFVGGRKRNCCCGSALASSDQGNSRPNIRSDSSVSRQLFGNLRLPLDICFNTLPHYPSVAIGKEDFE